MTSRVVIITRTRDRHLLLRRAIQSVLNQTFNDWKHVIVNDGGSKEELDALLREFTDSYEGRLTVIHHPQSLGMQPAANAGIRQSTSEFIAIHDDDDSWEPPFLLECVQFLDQQGPTSKYQGVISRSTLIEESISEQGDIHTLSKKDYIPLPEISLYRLGFENPFPPIAFLYRRAAYDTIGPYNPLFNVAGDYDFNFRFLLKFEIGVIPQPLANYHIRKEAKRKEDLNSVAQGADEHKVRYNEFKNHYLRGEDPNISPSIASALNAAKYLVEIEWVTHEARARAARIDPKVDQIHDAICGDAYADRFCSIRDALAIIVDHLRNPHLQNLLDSINEKASDLQNRTLLLDTLHHQLVALEHSQSPFQETLGLIHTIVVDLQHRSIPLEELLNTLYEKVTSLQSDALPLQKRLDSIHQQTVDIQDKNTSTQESLQSLHQKVAELEKQRIIEQASQQERIEQLEQNQSQRLQENAEQLQQLIQENIQNLLAQQEAFQEVNNARLEVAQHSIKAVATEVSEITKAEKSDLTLFKIGPFKISWKKKTHATPPPSDHS